MELFSTGTICGIVIVAILIGIYVVTRHRRAAARCSVDGPDSTGLLSTPASTSIGSEPSMHQRSYVRPSRDIRAARF